MENDNFKFGIPVDLQKGKNSKGEERMLFKGRASTGHKDSQGENLDVNGFDTSSFSIVNWNHSKNPDCIIGQPTKSTIKDGNLDIEGELYPEMPQAVATYNLMKALKKRGKGLYFSVEGKVLERDKLNPSKITKAKITGVAITPHPINSNTFCELIEKGYTDNNEWAFDEETEALIKASTSVAIDDEDEETEKAITAESGVGVTSKESVETEKDKKPIKNLEEAAKVVLKKSDIFEKIYNYNSEITVEKAKSVYSLIEKITAMNPEKNEITDETISKAFDILGIASEEISKAKAASILEEENKKTKEVEKAQEEDLEDEDEKEMVAKAKDKCKVMKAEGKDGEAVKLALIKKGYGEKVIEKAMKDEVTEDKKEVVSKSEIENLSKSLDSQIGVFNEKFEAITTILKSQVESNNDLKKSFDSVLEENNLLKAQIENISKTPNQRKTITTSSYSEKFEKSEGGSSKQKFNLKDKTDRNNLKIAVMELSGINKGENYDKGLVNIAQELELTQTLTKSSDIQKLLTHGFELVAE